MAVPVVANILAVLVWLPLLELPDGAVIRPMGACALQFSIALVTFPVGMMVAAWAVATRCWREACFCFCFSLTPLFIGCLAADLISDLKHLVWAD
jgi:hypothetical protein